jgi:CxxC motif-containing protein
MKKELICINCPMGCSLEVTYDGGKIASVKGSECPRGKDYAEKEIFHPERVVTTTVRIKGAAVPVLPVKTAKPVPKDLGSKIVQAASKITVNAPVRVGDIIVDNILGTNVSLIATRRAERARP